MVEQVSSISPPSKPRPVPKFIFTDKNSVIDAYESFTKEGFERQSKDERPYNLQKQFLSKVDVSKGPIQVRVETIVRTMVRDPNSIKGEKKEYLTYTSQWLAKDWLGNIIACALEHEGKYMQQTKNTVTKFNPETGEEIVQYMKGVPREMFTIPWNKKTADSILSGEKYFGEDSINITNLEEVQYIGKFPNDNPGKTGFPYTDFMNSSYKELSEKSKTVKSPYLADLERRVNPYK